MPQQFDEVGVWSELKLEIIRNYAQAYSTILNRQTGLRHMYIDGFAGPGVHLTRRTGEWIPGSPLNALSIKPGFKEFHFIDAEADRTSQLLQLAGNRPDVFAYSGDCNEILPKQVFPRAEYSKFGRALCLLDPYNIDLAWNVVALAGQMQTIEIFLNFMIMDMNMNVLRHDPESVHPSQIERMERFWGDSTWRQIAYTQEPTLFGFEEAKVSNDLIAQAYRERLRSVAGFKHVPDPMPMRTRTGSTIYYLFFASPNPTGNKIVESIFNKYRQ